MDFGITIKPDIHIDRIVSLTQQAEASGFAYGWIFDSHVIWKEPFPLLTLMATSTQTMRLGTCVTNPAVRDVTVSASLFATLNLASRGRMQLGIGRGDSSRRVREIYDASTNRTSTCKKKKKKKKKKNVTKRNDKNYALDGDFVELSIPQEVLQGHPGYALEHEVELRGHVHCFCADLFLTLPRAEGPHSVATPGHALTGPSG